MKFPKVRDITLRILESCGIDSPPVGLEPLLDYFNARVVYSQHQPQSALLGSKDGWTIKVNSTFREERQAFRIAHELGHIYWSDPAHHRGDPQLGGRLEHFCSKFASLLLCPHQWLVRDAPEADYDLFALKSIYPNVSHEVLALRLCYLSPLVVAIFDNGKKYRRFASPNLKYPGRETALELKLYEEVDLYGEFRETRGEIKVGGVPRSARVRGYPVFSGSFRRIILVMTPAVSSLEESEEFEEDMPYPFPEY
ncbi:MAG: ImmA/IrrE family metallo-endopeptidase [Candidatus Glassbacteria bacterium]|nr:ImmA/IrrE family metallo-endopeptidase [Candidatus Glassbacteria bacterium]